MSFATKNKKKNRLNTWTNRCNQDEFKKDSNFINTNMFCVILIFIISNKFNFVSNCLQISFYSEFRYNLRFIVKFMKSESFYS